MFSTPLSTVISSLSLNHHLYADDTQHFPLSSSQLLLKYLPSPDCSETYSSGMSANLLTLNSPKTEFLIIGLKQQLSKIDILRSLPLILHTTLVLFLMNILLSLIRSHHFLSPAILLSDNSVVFVLTSILKQPVPSLPLFPLET